MFNDTFVSTAGIGVINESPIQYGFYYITYGMVNHTVPEGSGTYCSLLRLIYFKTPIITRPIGFCYQFFLQYYKFFFQVEMKPCRTDLMLLAPQGFTGCFQKVWKGYYLLIQLTVSFHCLLSILPTCSLFHKFA